MDYLPVLILVAALVAAGFVFLAHRRNEGKSDPVAALSDALRQAQEKLHQSIPVKPTVPPINPAPQIAPEATIKPPVVSTPPESAPVAPAPYSGPFRDINGKPDPMGQYTEQNWRQAQEQQVLMSVNYYGPVPAVTVSDDEALYLAAVAAQYPAKFYPALTTAEAAELATVQYAVLSGSRADVQRVINRAGSDLAAQFASYDPSTYSGRFVPLVESVMTGALTVRTSP